MSTLAETPMKPRSLNALWLLILLFALPPLAGWLFYFNPQWLPEGRSNHGTLIDPPRSVTALKLRSPDGSPFDWRQLRDRWVLTTISDGNCDQSCIDNLIELRQIRRATGANRQYIERLLILLPDPRERLEPPDLSGLEGTLVAIADAGQRDALLSIFTPNPSMQANQLFIVDPRLDLMMTHDTSRITAKEILQDLEKLLKVSQSWVKGGAYGHQ